MSIAKEEDSSASSDQQLVFVYGTLKSGQPNNARLLEYMGSGISVVGRAVTRYPYPLVLATEYNVPFMINEICYNAKRVTGELFRVSSRALAFLDYVESAPTLYCRERIEVDMVSFVSPAESDSTTPEEQQPAGSFESRWCWCYFLAHHNPNLVAPPFYSEYDCAKMPLNLDIESLTPQREEQIKRCIAREAQIMPL